MVIAMRQGYEDAMQNQEGQRNQSRVLKLKQAAEVLQCHPKTLRLMAQAGKIPARRVGKLWRFSADRLREWIEAS
jgi:excisionase family DNA binding protein